MVSGVSVAEAHVDPCIRIPPMQFARITLVGITVPIKPASYGLSFETSLTLRVMSHPLTVSVLLITIGTLSNTPGVMTAPLKTGLGRRQSSAHPCAGDTICGRGTAPTFGRIRGGAS